MSGSPSNQQPPAPAGQFSIEASTHVEARRSHPPHESQVLRRDLCADTVDRNAGGRAYGIAGALDAAGAPEERFRVHRPGGFGLLWIAFESFHALSAWMDAYGIVFGRLGRDLDVDTGLPPLPGESFELVLPWTSARFLALEDDGAAYDPGPHVRLREPAVGSASVSL